MTKGPAKKHAIRHQRGAPGRKRKTRVEKPTRKNHYLYQSKIDLAREILGAHTETEALDRALDLVIHAESLARGTEAMAGEDYQDRLGITSEIPGDAA